MTLQERIIIQNKTSDRLQREYIQSKIPLFWPIIREERISIKARKMAIMYLNEHNRSSVIWDPPEEKVSSVVRIIFSIFDEYQKKRRNLVRCKNSDYWMDFEDIMK